MTLTDWRDMIRALDLEGGGDAFYNYGSDKQRTRKFLKRNGDGSEDRIYLGGYELYRRRNSLGDVLEEIESLHLFEGEQRVLLVDDVIKTDRTHADGRLFSTAPIFRYQYSNHLGSVGVELDESAQAISYEEFYPYGTSAYRLMNSALEAPAKRYRYTGMERDEESGLGYHGARYYAGWLGRWVSCDPLGSQDGPNLYAYVQGNPVRLSDPTGNETKSLEGFLQWHLIQQSELRQSVTATAKGRGISQYLRNQYQEMASQWRLGAVDVGHVKSFWSLKAGEISPTYAQVRTENQLNGATIDKAAAAEARSKGEYARVKGADPTAKPGTHYGQPPEAPKLEGLGEIKPKVIGPTPDVTPVLPEPTKPSEAMPKQTTFDFEKELPVKDAPKLITSARLCTTLQSLL